MKIEENTISDFDKKDVAYQDAVIAAIGIVLIACNLRSPLSSVGPVLNEISTALQLSNISAGFLTAIPLIVFAGLSGIIGKISIKYTMEKLLGIALVFLITGLFLRVSGSVWTLFTGSALIGLGICFGNVLMPGFIKQEFPKKVGMMTGLYSVAMNLTAALAAGFSISIGKWTKMGWKGSLGVWVILAVLTLLVWLPQLLKSLQKEKKEGKEKSGDENLYHSKQAWNISIFMGLQSLMYYCFTAWLPAVLVTYGMSRENAGWVLSFLQLAMLPVTFLGPVIAARMKNQKILITFLSSCMLVGLLLVVFFKLKFIYLAAILFGVSNGLSFSLAMLFFTLRTQSTSSAITLSGMAQSIGYLLAAFGPPVFGKLFDLTNNWECSFYFLMVSVLFMWYFGFLSGRNKTVEKERLKKVKAQ